ncbi:MAG: universal stress protein [Betaproteobacteria bacterium]|nr:universal stress protein [Betaproteobacteria bacterium]
MFSHILIPTDGSRASEKAVRAGLDFARETGAKVTAYYAVSPRSHRVYGEGYQFPSGGDAGKEFARRAQKADAKYMLKIARAARDAGVAFDSVISESSPAKGIVEAAKRRDCDIIFMGTRALGGVSKLVRGSVTDQVLRGSKIPVLVYRD